MTVIKLRTAAYDTKIPRKLIVERKRDCNEVQEEEAVLEMYRQAIGDV